MSATTITINIDESPWRDVDVKKVLNGTVIRVGRLPHGMVSGASSVAVLITLDDGRQVIGEISLAHFDMAAAAFRGAEQRVRESN